MRLVLTLMLSLSTLALVTAGTAGAAPAVEATAPPVAHVAVLAGAGLVVLPGDGSYVVNAELMVGLVGPRADARIGVMAIQGSIDDKSLAGVYLRADNIRHLGEHYSLGLSTMVGVVAVGDDDDSPYPMLGLMAAPLIWRFGDAGKLHLSLWVGLQRNLSNGYVTPNGSLSLDRYF